MVTDALADHVCGNVIDNDGAVRARRPGTGKGCVVSKGQMRLASDAVGKAMSERRMKFPPKSWNTHTWRPGLPIANQDAEAGSCALA